MNYNDQLISTHNGSPLELYKFESDVAPFFYTNNNVPYSFAGDIYKPIQISRGLADVGGFTDSAVTVDVKVSVSSELFLRYGKELTPPTLKVTIYKVQRGATGFKRQLIGSCTGHAIDGETYVLSFQNLLQTQFNASIAQVIFDNKCNNLFGDKRCKFDVSSVTVSGNVTDATDFVITTDVALVADKYVGGVITIGRQKRLIIGNDTDSVTVAYPFLYETGTTCTIAQGCNLSRTACLSYDNIDNYSGFMAIPTDNPLETDLAAINAQFLAQKNTQSVGRWRPAPSSVVPTVQPSGGISGPTSIAFKPAGT